MTEDQNYYPDNELNGRSLLAYQWIPEKTTKLLDAGCSYGYSTVYFSEKAQQTYGIDINHEHIEAAKNKYPGINFIQGEMEALPFEDEFFDTIIMMDVLEHTNDRIKSLSEICRVLKKGGKFIFSTPHKGTYAFLDPYNYGYYLLKKMPLIYKVLFKFVQLLKNNKLPDKQYNPEHTVPHYHYTERDLLNMLDDSDFHKHFSVISIFKSGYYKEVTAMILESLLLIVFSKKRTRKILKNISKNASKDYWKEYGSKSYNIAMMIEKK